MAEKKKNNPLGGLLFGPALIGFSLLGLWKNEHRFDYHQAASRTEVAQDIHTIPEGTLLSYTGEMAPDLTFPGDYVTAFTGYLTVRRSAEIYAWDRDEDSDGDVTWSRRWMGTVEGNSRNQGIVQRLGSGRFLPSRYHIGEMVVDTANVQFVDRFREIPVSSLTLDREASTNLTIQDGYFYLTKNRSDRLGDERLSYKGLPVPEIASYFGKFGVDTAIAHQAMVREGMVNAMIADKGILHHVVAGDREVALATMKAHIKRLKLIVRGVGTAVNVLGWLILFGTFSRFLLQVPIIGDLLQWGVLALALVFGLTLSFLTITAAFMTSQPWILALILVLTVATFLLLRTRAKRSQNGSRSRLESEIGQTLSPDEMKELEFTELASIAFTDGTLDFTEKTYLTNWARRLRWDSDRVERLIADARNQVGDPSQHLDRLIRLILADGEIGSAELKTLKKAAHDSGVAPRALSQRIARARRVA